MKDLNERLARLGVKMPEILLPRDGVAMETWAVIACDQFSSQKEYWEAVKREVGEKHSTFHMVYPECYLHEADKEARVTSINGKMREYLDTGVFQNIGPGFVLVDRETSSLSSRTGIIVAVDLERYDFSEGSKSLIRPTEGTILDRLPPRMKIRERAAVELPHILLLIDDPEGQVVEKAAESRDKMEVLYDFDLMQGGGHVTGRKIDDAEILGKIADGLEKLCEGRDLLFAVGDGNHSLATAKEIWRQTRDRGGEAIMNHPARWALVEVVNIFGKGLKFEAIHRVLFNTDPERALVDLQKTGACRVEALADMESVMSQMEYESRGHRIGYVMQGEQGLLTIRNDGTRFPAEALQSILDTYLEEHGEVRIDYIHGDETLIRLGAGSGNLGFLLPSQEKEAFFPTIMEMGAFPRKTFSIGEAKQKRYYIEARRIVP